MRTTRHLTRVFLAALLLPATAGCSLAADAIRSGMTPDPSACDFAPGQATREQVEATWGSPDGWKRESGGQVKWIYKKGFASATAQFNERQVLTDLSCERKG